MKVLLFTHEQDIDGMGSALLGLEAFEDFTYVPSKTFEIDAKYEKELNNRNLYILRMIAKG